MTTADDRRKAAATASTYDQGNIKGLDDATTRRLVASTVLTESHGGDLAVTNKQGYVGRYQAGASWLVEAGYVDRDKYNAAYKASGHKSEWDWAVSGGMTKFLERDFNWKNGLDLDQYKASADLQDKAFKTNSDKLYDRAVKNGLLDADDSPEKVAGFLKASHIGGYGAGRNVLQGKSVHSDANGTSPYDYYNDIVKNRDGLNQVMGRGGQGQSPGASSQATTQPAGADGQLKRGEEGAEIVVLQKRLNALGYGRPDGDPLAENGKFGPNTEAAVIKFQKEHGLEGLGVVGPKTLAALDAAEKAQSQGQGGQTTGKAGMSLNAAYDMSVKYDDVKYGFGSKNLASGKVDCSGWVSQMQNATMEEINQKAGKTVFSGKDFFDKNNQAAADIIKDSVQTTGTLMRSPLDKSQLKEGMIIGEDNGQKGWDKGRYNGIDHITTVVKDPKTGQLMVSQSRGGEGVELTTLDKYLERKQANGVELFATDPLAKARPMIEAQQTTQTKSVDAQTTAAIEKPQAPLLSNAIHPDHGLYQQAMKGLEQMPAGALKSAQERENVAAAIAFEAKVSGFNQIDNVKPLGHGPGMFVVQGALDDPSHKRIYVDQQQVADQSAQKSSELAQQVQAVRSDTQPKQDQQGRAFA